MLSRFKYSFRPGYGSANFLIELLSGVDEPEFVSCFMNSISAINPVMTGAIDLWMNDEVQLEFKSDIGSFTFSKDTWGFAFIEASNNQEGLKRIDALLMIDDRFEKVVVDPESYK